MKTKAIRSFSGAVLVLCLLLPGLTNSALAQQCLDDKGNKIPCYEKWVANGPYDQNSAATGEHSGLVTWDGGAKGWILDTDVTNLFKPLVKDAKIPFVWVFSLCFGGGMFDELNGLAGTQSGVSASDFWEPAIYQLPMPLGNGVNFSTAYIQAIRKGTTVVQPMALAAADNDPWGPSPAPAPPRDEFEDFEEQPIYFTTGAAADALDLKDHWNNGAVILWSGRPDISLDGAEISRLIFEFTKLNYNPANIWVLYGSGRYSKTKDLVGIAVATNKLPAAQLRAATLKQLKFVIAAIPNNDFVFFFANDHGYNNARGGIVPRQAWGGQNPYSDYYPPSQNDDIGNGDN
jgi:hypothetical protein